jgi:ElaB/YqjD/DUF883 family membrane-anchored ribosome-binding protein
MRSDLPYHRWSNGNNGVAMREDSARLVAELQQLWNEFENLVGIARAAVSEQADELGGQVRDGVDRARAELRQRARHVDGYVRENAWAAIAVAAAAAFVIGVLVPRRR